MNDGLNGLRALINGPLRRASQGATYSITFLGQRHELPSTDSQRQKVYDAENSVFTSRPKEFKTRRGMEGRVNRILKSPLVAKLRREFNLPPKGHVQVELRRAHSRSTSYGGLISFSKTSMCEWVLLHELAHEIAPRGAHHHWPFAYVYLKLVSRYLGAAEAKKLKAAFKAHGVRFKPKRTRNMTPEQRAAAAERLRKGRELRAAKPAEPRIETPAPEISDVFLPPFTD